MALLEQKNKRKTISQRQTTTAKQTVIVNIGEGKKKRKPRKKAAKKETRPTLAISSHPYAGAIFQTPNVPDANIGRLYGELKDTINAINLVRERVQATPLTAMEQAGLAKVNSMIYKMPDLGNTQAVESWLQGASSAPPESIAPPVSEPTTTESQKPVGKIKNLIQRIDKALEGIPKKKTKPASTSSQMPYYSPSAGSVYESSGTKEAFNKMVQESKQMKQEGIEMWIPEDVSTSEAERFTTKRAKDIMRFRTSKRAEERSKLPPLPPLVEPYAKAKRTIKAVKTMQDIMPSSSEMAGTSRQAVR